MAVKASITSRRIAGTLARGYEANIDILAPLRAGVAAMSEALGKRGDRGDKVADRAFDRSLDELHRLDLEILAAPTTGIADLKAKAAIIRQRAVDDLLLPEQLTLLLDSIDGLAN